VSYDNVGRRYAQAIFELGKEEGSLAALASSFNDFAAMYETSDELRAALDNPLVPEDQRNAILSEIAQKMGAPNTAQRALRVVAARRRLKALPAIARHLGRLVDLDAKMVRVVVTSAAPLTEGYLAKLKAEVEAATGSKATVEHSVDPSLIAGVITKIGDRVIDGSARSRLRTLRSNTDVSV
jgi:F-type H+-transporting ATPase subunit delta